MACELRDYLELTRAQALAQWASMLARRPIEHGQQVDFVPVETLLCLAASFVVSHHRYGGRTAHLAPQPVPSLARLFRRPNSSILAKMANLDGSRRNGAKHEIDVAARLLSEPEQLTALYQTILAAARDSGVNAQALPDFLALEQPGTTLLLLGQEELATTDVETAMEPSAQRWAAQRADLDENLTERLLVAAARIGQHRFAHTVLDNHGHRCVFCGLSLPAHKTAGRRLLIASHIKPWRASTNSERLDHRNGLAACPTHDAAFDSGLLTVNGGLRIHLALYIERFAATDVAAAAAFGRPPLAARLILPAGADPPLCRYLDWHRENVAVS